MTSNDRGVASSASRSVAIAAAITGRSERTVVITSDSSDVQRLLTELGSEAAVFPV